MKIKSLFESIFDNVIILEEGVNYAEMLNKPKKYIDQFLQEVEYYHEQMKELVPTIGIKEVEGSYTNALRLRGLNAQLDDTIRAANYYKEELPEKLVRRVLNVEQFNRPDIRIYAMSFQKHRFFKEIMYWIESAISDIHSNYRNFVNDLEEVKVQMDSEFFASSDSSAVENLSSLEKQQYKGELLNWLENNEKLKEVYNDFEESAHDVKQQLLKDLENLTRSISADGDFIGDADINEELRLSILEEILEKYKDVPFVQEFRFTKDYTLVEIKAIFEEEGEKHRKMSRQIMVNFDNGWVWMHLGTHCDKEEASKMSNCGTAFNRNAVLISLRNYGSDDPHDPDSDFESYVLATFDPSIGELSEIQGPDHSVPDANLHSYIMELLLHPDVKSIDDDDRNFQIENLSNEHLDILLDRKPELVPVEIRLERLGATSVTDEELETLPPKEWFQITQDSEELKKRLRIDIMNNDTTAEWEGDNLKLTYTLPENFDGKAYKYLAPDLLRDVRDSLGKIKLTFQSENVYQDFINLSNIDDRLKLAFNDFFDYYIDTILDGGQHHRSYYDIIFQLRDALGYNLTEFWANVLIGIFRGELKADAFPALSWSSWDGGRNIDITDATENHLSHLENSKYHTIIPIEKFLDRCTDSWEYDVYLSHIQFIVPNQPSGLSISYYLGDLDGISYGYGALSGVSEVYNHIYPLIAPELAHPAHPYSKYFNKTRNNLNEAFTEIGRNLP